MSLVVPDAQNPFQVRNSWFIDDQTSNEVQFVAHSASPKHKCRWQAQGYVCIDGD